MVGAEKGTRKSDRVNECEKGERADTCRHEQVS